MTVSFYAPSHRSGYPNDTPGVNNGRIGKTTPVKKNARKNAVKLEAIENSFSSMVDEDFADVGSPNSGFDGLDFDSGINLFG